MAGPSARHVDQRIWARDVAAALAGLPAQQAHAVRLLYFEHLPDREVAARMGVALTQARAAAAEGLRNLGQAFQELSTST